MSDQDLVAQLRGHNDPRLYHEADVLMSTAADAIEMLQQEVARWKNHHETEVRRARVLVSVKGGVADAVWDEGVDVEIFDWDNYEAGDKQGVSSAFSDLAAHFGAPVEESNS